jgi:hypothetical protein
VASSRLVTKSTNAHERKTRCAKGTPRCAPRPKSRLLPDLKITPTVKVRPSGVTSQSKGSRDVHRTYVVGHVTTYSRPGMSQHIRATLAVGIAYVKSNLCRPYAIPSISVTSVIILRVPTTDGTPQRPSRKARDFLKQTTSLKPHVTGCGRSCLHDPVLGGNVVHTN